MFSRLVREYGRPFFAETWFSANRSTARSKVTRPLRGIDDAGRTRPRGSG